MTAIMNVEARNQMGNQPSIQWSFIMRKFSPIREFAKATAIALATFSAQAALVNPAELPKMVAQAQKNGATPVVVHLAPTSIEQLRADLKGVNAAMAQRSSRLLAELGQQIWDGGRWDNGLGQIGLYVTEAGLKMLQNSSNAVSFYADQSWSARSKLSGLDGSHAEIDRLLDSNGYVDVAVTLNVDGLDFDTLKDGSVRLRPSVKTGEEGRTKAKALLDGLSAAQAPGKNAALTAVPTLATPAFTVRLTREGVVKLSASDLVRSLKPVGFSDARPLNFNPDVLVAAQRDGAAQVVITIRTPITGGNQSAASFATQTQSHRRALDGLLADAGVSSKLQDLSMFGAMAGRLTWAEIQGLKASKDSRLLSVELNRAMGSPSLATSTGRYMMNMQVAWNANFRAAGQNIVVLDTGMQTNHEFFKDVNGSSRVFFEGCYGTNQLVNGVQWESICPQQGANGAGPGDSPGGLAGSAAPRLNCASQLDYCQHGTHVAGISAGRASLLLPPTGLQGVAPDARIAAFQVFSYDQARLQIPTVFDDDLIAVMQNLASIMTPGTANNPFVINMSLGGGAYVYRCPGYSAAFTTAVETLFNLGVPVVASTGNQSLNTAINWPACVPHVLKVGAVPDDSFGSNRASYSNLADPSQFPGEFFWLAPGGDGYLNGVGVRSAIPDVTSTTQTRMLSGTSMAAPHIAGFYAVLKAVVPGIAINDVSNWIHNNAAVPVYANLCTVSAPCSTQFLRTHLTAQ